MLRTKFNKDPSLKDKTITYTTRYNAFWNNAPDGWSGVRGDGEALDINNHLINDWGGKSLGETVDFVQIMAYDCKPSDCGAPDTGFELKNYQAILSAVEKVVPKNKIIVGFEPGKQWNKGVWEGATTDEKVIDYLKGNGYGGAMFWAINQTGIGANVLPLAAYAKGS